jgi:hypothetical protein
VNDSNALIIQNLITGNQAIVGGGIYWLVARGPRLVNIFSSGGVAYGGNCSDRTGTDGNISADPQFIAPTQGDYHLQQGSPSIDAGNNLAPNLPDTDIDEDPRILDGDGNGTATIDMGVDEFLLPPGLKISFLDESNRSSKNSLALFICDLSPCARTPGRRPKKYTLRASSAFPAPAR